MNVKLPTLRQRQDGRWYAKMFGSIKGHNYGRDPVYAAKQVAAKL